MPFDLPPVTRALLIANVAVYLLQMLTGDALLIHFALWPLGPSQFADVPGFEPWQLVTYCFPARRADAHRVQHARALDVRRTDRAAVRHRARSRCTTSRASSAPRSRSCSCRRRWTGGYYPTLGASGGVFGLLLAYGMMYPHARILLLFPPIPMPAWLFVIGYGVVELFLGVTGIAGRRRALRASRRHGDRFRADPVLARQVAGAAAADIDEIGKGAGLESEDSENRYASRQSVLAHRPSIPHSTPVMPTSITPRRLARLPAARPPARDRARARSRARSLAAARRARPGARRHHGRRHQRQGLDGRVSRSDAASRTASASARTPRRISSATTSACASTARTSATLR